MGLRPSEVTAILWIVLIAQASCGPAREVASPVLTLGEITPSAGPQVNSTDPPDLVEPAISEDAPSHAVVPCVQFVTATDPDSGPLNIMYATRCQTDPETTPTQLWLWNQASQQAALLPLPEDARGPRPSSDLSLVLFRRAIDEMHQELWVVERNGSHERKVATISFETARERFPEAYSIGLEYGWIQNTHLVFYETRPLFDLELGRLDAAVLVEATSGVAVSLVPPDEVIALRYSPDGAQVAAAGDSEVRLIDPSNGRVHSIVSLPWNMSVENPLQYSPDGRTLTVLTDNGVAIVDTSTGRSRRVPLEYLLWGAGDWFLYFPSVHWRDASTALMLIAPPFEVDEQALDAFTELLDWEFGIYMLNAAQGTVSVTQTFRGIYPSAKLSPDLNLLAYEMAIPNSETRELHVADLNNGAQVLYATGHQISFVGWAPDSRRFFFAETGDQKANVYLGQLGEVPIPFDIRPDSIIWLDMGQFIAKPTSSTLELRLYTVEGASMLIASEYD